ncbi:31650_t:CDS:2 [Gigaspora margarita]|uniref:31650_t:CDS:1 n=1 Tax=Gigaspora margarita TaxID=4874 RepID=A0ABN7VD29_GIGMA|nr:31650_t:CDS:2 [Gigaspora margarita]
MSDFLTLENHSEHILYDIDVAATWKPDDELADHEPDSRVKTYTNTNEDPSYAQFPRRVFKQVTHRLKRSLEGLIISTTVPPALLQECPKVTSEWLMQLSPDGKYLAVLQEHKIEIRTSESGFEKNHAIYNSKRDAFSKWRCLVWSLDSKLIAATRSDGTIEIINEDGQLVCMIISSSNINSDIENDSQGGQSFFLEPVAFISFVDPKRGSNNSLNYEGHVYQYELIVITYDSVLRSYLLNTIESAATLDGNETISRRVKVNITYSREGAYDPGFFAFYHKISFKQWLSTIVCGAVVTLNGSLLCLGGKPNNEDEDETNSPSVVCWMLLPDRPFYRKLELKGMENQSIDDISDLSQGTVDDIGFFSRLKNVFATWRKVNKSFTDEIVYSMIPSPDKRYLLTLDFSGTVSLWKISTSKGVEFDKSWDQSHLNYFARGKEYQNLSFEKFQDKIFEIENDGGDVSGVPGLDNGKILSIEWWTNNAFILGFQNGSVIIASLPNLRNILGDSPETFKSCYDITCQCNNYFLVIEHEVKSIRARVHGDNIISYSRAQEEDEMEDDEFEDSTSQMSRLISAITNSLHYITDTFLWHFENDSSTIRGRFITISKRTFRLNRISKILPQDLLCRKINALEYDDALVIAKNYNLDTDIIYQARWKDAEVSETAIHDNLDKIHDKEWVLSACFNRITKNPNMIRLLLCYGLDRTDILDEILNNNKVSTTNSLINQKLREHPLKADSEVQKFLNNIELSEKQKVICRCRYYFLKYLDRLSTYERIVEEKTRRDIENGSMDSSEENGNWITFIDYSMTFDEDYAIFRDVHIAAQAMDFAADEFFDGLSILFTRHGNELLPYRFTILEQIPETADPDDYESFLPRVGTNDGAELSECLWHQEPWRVYDWVENSILKKQILQEEPEEWDFDGILMKSVPYPASASYITQWYVDRARKIDSSSGQVDKALSLVRYGIKKNVENLKTLEEDLHMLSQLVYNCYPSSNDRITMTLDEFESLTEEEIIKTFLRQTDETRIVNDVRLYIIPFLKLLPERRARKSELPDKNDKYLYPTDLLYKYILDLSSFHLDWCCLLFEASKPTLPAEERVITSDEDLAKVALACLYGNTSTNDLNIQSRIFECLPILDSDSSENNATNSDSGVDIGLLQTYTPHDFLLIFKAKNKKQLQKIINSLEIHINAAKILARYNNTIFLRWFLQSAKNYTMQKQLCIQLSRRASNDSEFEGEHFDNDSEWIQLLEEMKMLQGDGKGVLGEISIEGIYEDFISGLLSCGKFRLASEILLPTDKPRPLEMDVAEKLVINASREFFDNATSGNMNHGYMKMAYECLQILPISDTITSELEFIEATHILSEKKICYQPGVPIHPMQIRLSSNRLDFIDRLLSTYEDAYLDPKSIIKLAKKLGYRKDKVAEVKVMAMLADSALHDNNFDTAYCMCIDLVNVVKTIASGNKENAELTSANDVAWRICYEVAKQENYRDLEQQITLMGYALSLCPSDQITDILNLWRKLEEQRSLRALEAKSNLMEKSVTEKVKPAVERVESVLMTPLLQGDRLKNLVSSWLGSGFST